MSRLPILKAKEIIKVLHHLGFKNARRSGSHFFFIHPDGRATTVPYHGNRDISRGLLRKIISDIELVPEEFVDLL